MVIDKFAELVFIVNGTEIAVYRPQDNELQKKIYSPKKKQHSLNSLIFCSLTGSFF